MNAAASHCPVCSLIISVEEVEDATAMVFCPKCQAHFEWGACVGDNGRPNDTSFFEYTVASKVSLSSMLAILGAAVALVIGMAWFGMGLNGPAFLILYLTVFGVTFTGQQMIRHSFDMDSWAVTVTAFLAFEAIGLHRWWIPYQQGMEQFGLLNARLSWPRKPTL